MRTGDALQLVRCTRNGLPTARGQSLQKILRDLPEHVGGSARCLLLDDGLSRLKSDYLRHAIPLWMTQRYLSLHER